jgi:hypothetical protein
MEHAEAREFLEIAAVEPGGFDRLIAGDTPEASLLASHLAGCADCTEEMERLRVASSLIGRTVRSMPPPELRDRTLALVGALGRDRSGGPVAPSLAVVTDGPGAPAASLGAPISGRRPVAARPAGSGRRLALWAASLAAAVVIAVAGTSVLVGRIHEERAAAQAQQIASLAKVATWSLRIDGQPDARYVELTSPSGASASLLFSPTSSELVVLASNLPLPPDGMEYRCWMETAGRRAPIGKMFFGGGVSYWVGDVDTIAGATEGTRFGVSLVPIGGDVVSGEPVLLGEL